MKWVLLTFGFFIVCIGLVALLVFVVPTNRIDGIVHAPEARDAVIYVFPFSPEVYELFGEYYVARFNHEGQEWEVANGVRDSIDADIVQEWQEINSWYLTTLDALKSNPSTRQQALDDKGRYVVRVPYGRYLAIIDLNGKLVAWYNCPMYVFERTDFRKSNIDLLKLG